MDIQKEKFIKRFKSTFVYDLLSETLTDEQLFEHVIDTNGDIIWFKDQTRQMWFMWQAAQKVAVPDRHLVVNKGDYVELVKTNRERQETIARLTEEVRIIRDRKKFYKNQCKAQSIPEGFVLVPKEPTEEMIDAGHDFCKLNIVTPSGFYKAMIEAQEQVG